MPAPPFLEEALDVATVLDKQLKRQIGIDGADYTVAIDPDGLQLTAKGKRRPLVVLRWSDLVSGEAAMAIALNASLSPNAPKERSDPTAQEPAGRAATKKPRR